MLPNTNTLAAAFHATANVRREDIFRDHRLQPIRCLDDARTSAPGWVGSNWMPGGTVLMGINPGGGGDNYRINSHDTELYALIRALRDANGEEAMGAALSALSAAWISVQATHSLNRVITAVLAAVGQNESQAAFLNVLPFRTRNDKPARKDELRRAWQSASGPQVAALQPRRIVALGCKAHDALLSVGADQDHEVILIKRSIGDKVITQHAKAVLQRLRAETESSR